MKSNRIDKLIHLLPNIGAEAILIENPINVFYLTGLEFSKVKLLVSQNETALIVDGRYFEACSRQKICSVYLLDKMPLKMWLSTHSISSLAFESDKTTYQDYLKLSEISEELKIENKSLQLIPLESPVLKLRMIKDHHEIQLLSEAAQLGYQGYEFILSKIAEGITELELAFELEFFWKKRGAKTVAFDPIIAFGENSSMPHYRAGHTKLKKGMHVLIDIGVTLNHYNSDMTRIFFFGEPHEKIKEIYTIVEKAKNKALALCKPGIKIGELDRAARQYIEQQGYGEMFTHNLGHGVGLEVHEPPIMRSKGPYAEELLQPGMVITIEPGIYLPSIGGIRLEDTVLITEQGYRNLTGVIT